MNDFFSVLDDFEFEEFVATMADGDGSSASDSLAETDEGTAPKEVVDVIDDVADANVEEVVYADVIEEKTAEKAAADAKAEGKTEVQVWENAKSPISGSTDGVVLGIGSNTSSKTINGVAVQTLTLRSIVALAFTAATETALTIGSEFRRDGMNLNMSATGGVAFGMSNGKTTGGKMTADGSFTLRKYAKNADGIYEGEGITVGVNGFFTEKGTDAVEFGANDDDLKSIVVPEVAGGEVTVSGDVDFTFNGESLKLSHLNETKVENFSFSYDDDKKLTLDLSGITAANDETLTVKAAGGADYLVVPAGEEESIKIGKVTYDYTSAGKAIFALDGTDVVGYALVSVGDSITVNSNDDIVIYDEDIVDVSKLVSVDGANYTVTKLEDGYSVAIDNSAKVTVNGVEFDFTISSATAKKTGDAATIYFDEDEIIGVYGVAAFTANDSMKVTGAVATNDESGLAVLAKNEIGANVAGYLAVDKGEFTYVGGTTPSVTVNDKAIVYAVNGVADVFVDETGGTITNAGEDFTYSGKGYFVTNANNEVTGFVFVDDGDKVFLSTEDAITVYDGAVANANIITVPTVTDADKEFAVTMTDTNKFRISDLGANATVVDSDTDIVEFSTEGGEVTFNKAGNMLGVYNYVGDRLLTEEDSGLIVNGNELILNFVDDNQIVTGTSKDGKGVDTITGLADGDIVGSYVEGTADDAATVFAFDTDGVDTFTVNGRTYTVKDDFDGVTISADGKVEDLDEEATLTVYGFKSDETLTVNGVPYTGKEIEDGTEIIGYQTKDKKLTSYWNDPDHPLINGGTSRDRIKEILGVAPVNASVESAMEDPTLVDFNEVEGSTQYTFNTSGNDAVIFNKDVKGNVAIVNTVATGNKSITLGDKGDAVIMDGTDENGSVNITTGAGNDTIVVRGNMSEDTIFRGGSMKTTINMNSDGIDKVITYAAANADITLNNYDVTGKSGVVVHDPELPYIKEDIKGAIEDGLLVFEDNSLFAIDRGEADGQGRLPEGTDRKTQITVNNVATNPGSMVRLFGYKDSSDDYSDDFGQVVGFTNETGGTIDASSFKEEVVLVGNYNGKKTGGSVLIGGDYDDTLFGGAGDSLNAGGGVNNIVLEDDDDRDAAVINAASGYVSIDNINYDDVIDVTNHTDNIALTFEDGVLGFVDVATKTTIEANVDETWKELGFVHQTFADGNTELKTAVAETGKSIIVTDDYEPNYFSARDGGIDFRNYTGDVGIDVDGLDNDWSGPNYVGNSGNITIGSGLDSLFGGSGTTIFKGGADDETLVAGSSESSLYGAGGSNVLKGFEGKKTGSTEFFVIGIHNGAENRIEGFEAIADGGSNQATFDALNLGLADGNDVIGVKVNGDNVEIAVKGEESGATETATIVGVAGEEILIDRGTETETVAQIAASVVTINHDYVDFYEATETNAVVSVGSGVSEARVWLESPEHNGVNGNENHTEYVGDFAVIDASGSGASVELAGNNAANTIIGGSGNASMWGGSGSANDLMIAGSAHNEYYYEVGNGNDTIQGAKEGDIIHLGMSLDQIDFDGTTMSAGEISVKFTDGGTLKIDSAADVSFSFDDGTNVKANRQTGQFE